MWYRSFLMFHIASVLYLKFVIKVAKQSPDLNQGAHLQWTHNKSSFTRTGAHLQRTTVNTVMIYGSFLWQWLNLTSLHFLYIWSGLSSVVYKAKLFGINKSQKGEKARRKVDCTLKSNKTSLKTNVQNLKYRRFRLMLPFINKNEIKVTWQNQELIFDLINENRISSQISSVAHCNGLKKLSPEGSEVEIKSDKQKNNKFTS